MFSLKRAIASLALVTGILLCLTLGTAKAQVVLTYSGELTAASPTFQRTGGGAPPTTLGTGTTFKYHVRPFTVATSGAYALRSVADYDNFTILYTAPFDPSTPLTNVIAANDDLGNLTTSGFNTTLTAGVNYVFVTTSYSAATSLVGTFTNTVSYLGTPPSTQFQRPNTGYPPATTATATNYYYYTETWTPATTGFYKIKTVAPNFDSFTVLYSPAGFSPTNPLANIIVSNDTFANEGGASGFYFSATAGQTYTIVVTSSATGAFGTFTNEKTLIGSLRNSFSDTTVGGLEFTGGRPNSGIPPAGRSASTPPYKNYTMTVGTSGDYSFHMIHTDPVTTQYDTFLVIFDGVLNLADTSNAIAANDDFDTYTSFNRSGIVNFSLIAGHSYTIVATGYGTTSAGDFFFEAFGPGAVNIARPVTISGQITTPSPNKTLPITFVVRPVGGTAASDITKTVTIVTDAQGKGNYELKDIPSGTVNLVAKGEITLQTLVTNINANADVTGVNFTLRGGDGNQDGFADIGDLLLLIHSYNQIYDPTGGEYSALVDFNYDQANDISDLLILIGSYNQASQYLP